VKKEQQLKDKQVVAAIIVRDKKILATQRGYGDYAGYWEFPGGKTEVGETPQQALLREIHEELDADIKIDRFFKEVQYDYPDFHLVLKCFLCHLESEEISLLEHSDAKWLDAKLLCSVKWLAADLEVIEELSKYL
jgi:8-oxo-dGTP diphosphatase